MVRRNSPPERLEPPTDDRRGRERELVLAPNEQAYVLDTTKGHINCYVGPNKTSLAQTDQPVVYDPKTRRFDSAPIEDVVQLFATAPASWYMLLENPAQDDLHPNPGVSNGMVELRTGEKINVFGPASFPLWPGQTVQVIQGHTLRSNQFLRVRVYDPAAAKAGFDGPGEPPTLVAGQVLIVRGDETSFYMPPTGFEVLPDRAGRYVRDAVTLDRLQYCVLVREDGRRRYFRGEAVVFPEPDERFFEEDGRVAFGAIELSDTTGLHVKVTAPYVDEDGAQHVEGEELFLAGESRIYFPREEHALMRRDGHVLHHAIAIPRGEGRYALDRSSGEVRLVAGPCMFLPDPRREVLIQRVLGEAERALYFPPGEPGAAPPVQPSAAPPTPAPASRDALGALDRAPYTPPSAITLGPDPQAAVRIDVRSGHAIQVVDRGDQRRVVLGPASVLLGYDETLQPLTLSTGTPKSDAQTLKTAFLRVAGNEVSDRIRVRTRDLVEVELHVRHRVRFEGEDRGRWFAVDNYVQTLCDHARSLVAAAAQEVSVQTLRTQATALVREAVLGARTEAGRPGRAFEDNGMRVIDVDVLGVEIGDPAVAALLAEAQRAAIQTSVEVAAREAALSAEARLDEITRALATERHRTTEHELALERSTDAERQALARAKVEARTELQALDRAQQLADAERRTAIKREELAAEALVREQALTQRRAEQDLELARLRAQVEGAVAQASAFTPQLVAALDQLGNQRLLGSLAENFGELAAVEGRGLLETARKYLDFVPATVMPVLGAPDDEPS